MKKFNVLPTDERFQNLTDEQIDFIGHSMSHDAKVEELIAKGKDVDSYFEDDDTTWMSQSEEEFEVVKEGHDEEDIARQVDALTDLDSLEKAKARYNSAEEWNKFLEEGGETAIDIEKERIIQENFEKALEEAEERETLTSQPKKVTKESYKKMTSDSVKEAIDLFNEETDDDSEFEDDDFYI